MPKKMLLHENRWCGSTGDPARPRRAGRLRRPDGVGAALRSSGLQAGQTVAVYGCGGVGLSIIQGARIGAARQIIGRHVRPEGEMRSAPAPPTSSIPARRSGRIAIHGNSDRRVGGRHADDRCVPRIASDSIPGGKACEADRLEGVIDPEAAG